MSPLLALSGHVLPAAGTGGTAHEAARAQIHLRAGGLVIGGDALFNRRTKQLAALTVQQAGPAAYQWREIAAALISSTDVNEPD